MLVAKCTIFTMYYMASPLYTTWLTNVTELHTSAQIKLFHIVGWFVCVHTYIPPLPGPPVGYHSLLYDTALKNFYCTVQ